MARLYLLIILFNCFVLLNYSYAQDSSPCEGSSTLIDIVNRPTIADSACVVPNKQGVVELGYQYQKLDITGQAHLLQSPTIRFGIPGNTEFFTIVPNYYHESVIPFSGFGSTSVGLKHELAYKYNWVVSLNGYMTPPSGSYGFGTKNWSGLISVVANYNLDEKISITGELSVSRVSESQFNGAGQFYSINPDVFLTWKLREYIQIFGELYGQSKTGVNQGLGYLTDVGVIYLATKNLVLDLEVGHRINGLVWNVENYIGTGMSIQFE